MRNATDIPPVRKKKESVRRAHPAYKESAKAVHELASILHLLGFESEQILQTVQQPADGIIARNALLEARPPTHFSYDAGVT